MMTKYENLFSRNSGYIDDKTQQKIRLCHVLIAGCGVGSQVAVSLARMGFTKFTLIDGDEVSISNLNRQAYTMQQVGKNKALALAENILQINPECEVKGIADFFNESKISIVEGVDLIIDTIDFLDMKAILLLHDLAEQKKIPLFTGMTAGWGACAMYFSNQKGKRGQFRKIFNIGNQEDQEPLSYVQKFRALFHRLQGHIDPQVVKVMDKTFQSMLDNKPCPAPQVVSGICCLSSVITTSIVRLFSGLSIPEAPYMINFDVFNLLPQLKLKIYDDGE